MRRVAACAGRTAASGFTTPLTSCAMLGLTTLPHDGAQTSAQTPPSAASANAEPPAPRLDAQQPDASTTPSAADPDPLLAPVVMAATFAYSIIAIRPASRHCKAA